ncbi:MAG TPA: hypothetical protein DD473_16420 [Planctomycetaceae bacterium]|nr:hypothetical protein [Planctomycetaceae bacterium]
MPSSRSASFKATHQFCDRLWNDSIRFLICLVSIGMSVFDSSHQIYAQPDPPTTEKETTTEKTEARNTDQLPLIQDMKLPDVQSLLEGEKTDWIVLIGDRVLQVPAIWPRPDQMAWLEQEQKQLLNNRPANEPELSEWLGEYRNKFYIYLAVEQEGVEDDYRLHMRYVDYILYHEEICLRKVDELLLQGKIEIARRLLTAVGHWELENNEKRKQERLTPLPWPGLIERERSLLRSEVRLAQKNKDWTRGFSLIKRRFPFDREDPQLPILAAELLEQIAEESLQSFDYRRIRFYISQTFQMFPKNKKAEDWQARLLELAESQMNLAEQDKKRNLDREASLRAQHSVKIWPNSSQLNRRHKALQERYQTLEVGLLKDGSGSDLVLNSLRNNHWFYVEQISEGYPRFQSRFIETWRPDDLGRLIRLQISLKPQPLESRPVVDSHQLTAVLLEETLQRSPRDQDLYSNSIQTVQILSPDELEIQFESQTPHPLARLVAVLRHRDLKSGMILQSSHFEQKPPESPLEFEKPGRQFVRSHVGRVAAERRGIIEVHVREFESQNTMLQSLLRDELHVLPETPSRFVDMIRSDQRFFVKEYAVPRNWGLKFHFEGRLGSQAELRLALLSMLDRNELIESMLPGDTPGRPLHQLSSSLCPSTSHAFHPSPYLPEFDELSAFALVQLLKKSPQFPKEICLGYPPNEYAQNLAEVIKKKWERLGIPTKLIEFSNELDAVSSQSEMTKENVDVEIISYCMSAPHYELPALLSLHSRLIVDDLAKFPSYVRATLLVLENARNWDDVDIYLRQLQDQMIVNSWLYPIVESRRFMTIRREVRNLPEQLIEPFETIDHWMVDPVAPAF